MAESGLSEGVRAAVVRARDALPDIVLDEEAFARHLTSVAAGASPAEVSALAIEDLYLACACVAGAPGSVAAFTARHGEGVRNAIARVVRGADAAEIEQRVLEELLVGAADGRPKLASYAGRAPLERWLSVAAHRAALMWLRENRAEGRARDGAAGQPAPGDPQPEVGFVKERYRGEFEQALKQAVSRAPERDRVLLRLHFVNGLTMESIGKMYGVSQPTASRWLATAREGLLEQIKAILTARLGASSGELASLAALVASRIDLSLSLLLRAA